MRAALPVNVMLVDQLEERLVNQSSRLQGVLGPFAPEIAGRHSAQFAIDDWHEGVEGLAVAMGPARQQLRDVALRRCLHVSRGDQHKTSRCRSQLEPTSYGRPSAS